ncbi:cation diffusion facilitator family transporter [Secundilactobacillus folii]|uniref:Cation diffusion facilitator family transporter n=1 Tax=Secundilactobacillus folii TaxID=2678357 RepID=A0A7X2XWB4_9LACO|nr:cation diffusion facilitator family transporter [Secundilactobacillus folii]MTV81471.1 cation diffusion facilitator family transporter [Secundilactobacillus folii]
MNNLSQYLKHEGSHLAVAEEQEIKKLQTALRSLWINIVTYLAITAIEFWLADLGHSQALRADAMNNLSGVISTLFLIVGLHTATDSDDHFLVGKRIPLLNGRNDDRMQLSRFRMATIFTLITSFIIIYMSGQIIYQSSFALLTRGISHHPNIFSAYGAAAATLMMGVVWYLNWHNGKRLNNSVLLAASKDSMGDVATSLGTLITVTAASLFDYPWLDSIVSIIIGLFVLWSGLVIFQECTLNLADYVDPNLEDRIKAAVAHFDEVHRILEFRSRYNGDVLIVEMLIMVDANMNVMALYELTEKIEKQLEKQFQIFDVTTQAVPDPGDILDES